MQRKALSEYLTRYHKDNAHCTNPVQFRRSYLTNFSPWRDSLTVESYFADVFLGIDPGTFFCGGLVRFLAELGAKLDIPTGFIHVPPDAESVEGSVSLLPRAVLMSFLYELVHRVSCKLATSLKNDPIKVFLWGFGEFGVIQSNPTERFLCVGDEGLHSRGVVERDAILVRCPTSSAMFAFYPLVFQLAENSESAQKGDFFTTMEHVYRDAERQLSFFGRPDVVIGLGVDASQLANPFLNPTFILELQSQGFCCDGRGTNDPYFNSLHTINCSLVPYLVEDFTW